MTQYLPWNLPGRIDANLALFHGKDLTLSLSLSRMTDSILYPEEYLSQNMSIFLEPSLFEGSESIRSIVSSKFVNNFIKKIDPIQIVKKVILVVDGSINFKSELPGVIIKSDPLNARSRKWFINHHNKLSNINLPDDLSWINNLDDFKFACLIQKLEPAYLKNFPAKLRQFDIWSNLRFMQITNKPIISNLVKHFEYWARENVPNDETLSLLSHKMINELEKIKI